MAHRVFLRNAFVGCRLHVQGVALSLSASVFGFCLLGPTDPQFEACFGALQTSSPQRPVFLSGGRGPTPPRAMAVTHWGRFVAPGSRPSGQRFAVRNQHASMDFVAMCFCKQFFTQFAGD